MRIRRLGPKKRRVKRHPSGIRMAKNLSFRKARRYKLSGMSNIPRVFPILLGIFGGWLAFKLLRNYL